MTDEQEAAFLALQEAIQAQQKAIDRLDEIEEEIKRLQFTRCEAQEAHAICDSIQRERQEKLFLLMGWKPSGNARR